jgi:hypothetical protein
MAAHTTTANAIPPCSPAPPIICYNVCVKIRALLHASSQQKAKLANQRKFLLQNFSKENIQLVMASWGHPSQQASRGVAANRQEMCGALVTDPLGLGAKRRARSAPSGKFSRFRYHLTCFLIVLSLSLLRARFAQRFRCCGRASRARVPASSRASRATLIITPVTMSQLFLPVGVAGEGAAGGEAERGGRGGSPQLADTQNRSAAEVASAEPGPPQASRDGW